MLAFHSDKARHNHGCCRGGNLAPRAVTFCRIGIPLSTWFALIVLVLCGILTAASGYSQPISSTISTENSFDLELDSNRNGIEDVLDSWLQGRSDWEDLRQVARPSRPTDKSAHNFGTNASPGGGAWQAGQLRLICLGTMASEVASAKSAGKKEGQLNVIHDLPAMGGITVLSGDETGIRAFLDSKPSGRIMLDRDGTPALVDSKVMSGQHNAFVGQWPLGQDWSSTVAILDSGCDTAHNDLGDVTQDNYDGEPPYVGDATDWYDAAAGWPLTFAYKVMGWHDVTDDFPEAVGPWDYHHHGTALASVVAGRGIVDSRYAGMAPSGRLTVVKFYDFDEVWHSWAGDFLAACAWTLEHKDTYRIRTVLVAVNWDVDAGISEAMTAFVDAGILPVVAMGNDGPDSSGPGYPAVLPAVLTVGSMDRTGAVSWHSGRGLPGQDKPDLLAPGGGQSFDSWIITADNEPDDQYSGRQGTSIAAAHVAGASFMMQEALRVKGIPAASNRQDVLDQMAILKSTCSLVKYAENSAGTGWDVLPVTEMPLGSRGWGGLRIDAAVQSFSRTLIAGLDLSDTLSADTSRPVTACKLNLGAGIRYVVEAIPEPGLDVSLDIVNPRWLDSSNTPHQVQPHHAEFGYISGDQDGWVFAVVKRVSGEGVVQLRLREADSFTAESNFLPLPGVACAAPGFASGPNSNETLIVATSKVEIDLGARSIGVYYPDGQWYPQWPVFVFPGPASQGNLNRPLAWDLDGNPGDEIVVTSEFGIVYFLTLAAEVQQVYLASNVNLTNPVGIVNAENERLIATVDSHGVLRAWSWGPNLEIETDLFFSNPLDPAVGQILPAGGQEMVVSFSGGEIVLLDGAGNIKEGWPVELGVELSAAPVLLDLNGDGIHEIIQVYLDSDTGILEYHVFNGLGEYVSGEPISIPAPSGGRWIAISDPCIAGRYGVGNLRVVVSGIADNGLTGSEEKWHLVNAGVSRDLNLVSNVLPGFEIEATTDEGHLSLENTILSPPLTNDITGAGGGDPISLLALSWAEDLYGLTTIPGSFTGRVSEDSGTSSFISRRSLDEAFSFDFPLILSAAQAPLDPGLQLEVTFVDDQMLLVVWPLKNHGAPVWQQERCDKLNSGAYPLLIDLVAVPDTPNLAGNLQVYPNPGSGDFQFSWSGEKSGSNLQVQIYDLHGRHLRTLSSDSAPGVTRWDGKDHQGRSLSAGVYLAVGKTEQRTSVSRVVLMK